LRDADNPSHPVDEVSNTFRERDSWLLRLKRLMPPWIY
jgi:hypothetical protein